MSKDDNRIEQVAAIACVIDDGINENSEFEIEDDKEKQKLSFCETERKCK